jgi:uncharacterized phage infection (PIP) family protein YhgE
VEVDQGTADDRMDRGELYAAVVIPASFSQDLLSLVDPTDVAAAASASVNVVTNPPARLRGNGFGDRGARPGPAGGRPADRVGSLRPRPRVVIRGCAGCRTGATLVNSTVDSALGYATTETGSRWRQRAPVPISRWQTLLTKWAIAAVMAPTFVVIALLVAVGILGLDAPNILGLWAMMSLSAITVAAGTLALFTALGSLGQLLALVLFVYLALASSGATVPVEALPEPFAAISRVDPLHQAFAGICSLVYFDGQATDGWPQAVLVLGVALVFWLALGAAAALW